MHAESMHAQEGMLTAHFTGETVTQGAQAHMPPCYLREQHGATGPKQSPTNNHGSDLATPCRRPPPPPPNSAHESKCPPRQHPHAFAPDPVWAWSPRWSAAPRQGHLGTARGSASRPQRWPGRVAGWQRGAGGTTRPQCTHPRPWRCQRRHTQTAGPCRAPKGTWGTHTAIIHTQTQRHKTAHPHEHT